MKDPALVPSGVARDKPVDPAGSAAEAASAWLVLIYQLPAEPSSLRAAVGRKLSAAGAVYLSPACAAAPLSRPAERAMRRMRATITDAGGSAVLLTGRPLAGESVLAGAFNTERDLEYADITVACRDAVAGLEALTVAGELRYHPLWDGDIGFRQLSARYRAVRGHDLFGAGRADEAAAALDRYRAALNEYAGRVFAAGGRS